MTNAIRIIRLPDMFYHTYITIGGGRAVSYDRPNLDPMGEATAYVTDGEMYGLLYEDGPVWLGRTLEAAFGDDAEIVGDEREERRA